MPEWFKGVDSRSTVVILVGSNPTLVIIIRVTIIPFYARLAQLVERKTLNLVVVGSSPTVGNKLSIFYLNY